MDFSQLPKMSNTPAAAAPEKETPTDSTPVVTPSAQPLAHATPKAPPVRLDYAVQPAGGFGFGGVWISLIAGVICLLFGKNFGSWSLARLSGKDYDTHVNWISGSLAGQTVPYFQLDGGTAWTEMGLFCMGIALFLDAALMLIAYQGRSPHRALVLSAVGLTSLAVAVNIGLVVYLLKLGVLPMLSLVALMVGGMVLFDHLPLLRRK